MHTLKILRAKYLIYSKFNNDAYVTKIRDPVCNVYVLNPKRFRSSCVRRNLHNMHFEPQHRFSDIGIYRETLLIVLGFAWIIGISGQGHISSINA